MANLSTAALLREARTRAGLTQSELAKAAGVAQSVISAYETGNRTPSLPMLRKLVEATGHDLVIDLTPRHLPAGSRLRRLRDNREAVIECAARHGARNVRVFGSSVRGDDTESSDIDLLVDLDEGVGLLDLIGLEDELTDLLGAKVEVVPASSLRPHVRRDALAEAATL
jgi:predicted nucleotidyltransferase/DNA-binding XRE family transcriptional regulator